ncbi:phosphotransferase [Streptomyces sp. NPDC059506]|uniref:phosphotransferase n=1 Tax=Streptomyces sp. NPDC059506 TaxID=3347751 RepID=UPI0036D1B25A
MTAPAPVHGGFSQHEMQTVLDRACAAAGLDSTDAGILRGHTNAVVRLARDPVVVKIARRGSRMESVERTVHLVQWLMSQGFPTVALHPGLQQPIVVDGHAVTFWTYLPQPEHPVAARQIAGPLRTLHSFTSSPVQLPHLDNIGAIRRSISVITSVPVDVRKFLSARVDHLEARLMGLCFDLRPSVIQSDPQHRNALHHGDGAVLCDWDTAAIGQPEWDLVTIEIHCRRFGYGRDHYQAFADAYGYDITQHPGYPVLRDLRELRMVTTNAKKTAHTPGSLEEVERRIEGFRQQDVELPWRIL